jgi:ribosomal protein S18 acetylase RimI-like enzyme
MEVVFLETLPEKHNFFILYETTGWNNNQRNFPEDDLFNAIKNSWYTICAYHNNQLIGFGRIISDGIYQTFICDLIVQPQFQDQGIGKEILEKLINHCKVNKIKWIQLTCAQGKAPFYEKFGFKARQIDAPGMQLFI